jgi:hypothetical protein
VIDANAIELVERRVAQKLRRLARHVARPQEMIAAGQQTGLARRLLARFVVGSA